MWVPRFLVLSSFVLFCFHLRTEQYSAKDLRSPLCNSLMLMHSLSLSLCLFLCFCLYSFLSFSFSVYVSLLSPLPLHSRTISPQCFIQLILDKADSLCFISVRPFSSIWAALPWIVASKVPPRRAKTTVRLTFLFPLSQTSLSWTACYSILEKHYFLDFVWFSSCLGWEDKSEPLLYYSW